MSLLRLFARAKEPTGERPAMVSDAVVHDVDPLPELLPKVSQLSCVDEPAIAV